ncbi:MAG TPA: hypothetical protein VKD90_27965 [Gemmataceae bacterium]|nr:hypothetical protein [Gemmataceae bacterium]
MSDDDRLNDREADGSPADDDHALAWEWRVFAVAVAWIIPGVVFGSLIGLVAPTEFRLGCLVAGGLLGFAAGGLLEADYWG